MTSDYRQAITQAMQALQARDHQRAAELLRAAATTAPLAEMAWVPLANAELALGQNDAAEAAIDQQLLLKPREVGALLLKAYLREQARDARAASSFYRTALGQAALEGNLPPALAALHAHAGRYLGEADKGFEAYLIDQVGTALSPTMAEAIELLTGKRELYLQEPSVFYYPGLPQKRFYDPAEFPWFQPMLALVPQMQAELAAVLGEGAEGFAPYVHRKQHRPAPNTPLLDSQDWTAFHFWRDGELDEGNAARCPATMEALSHAPLPQIPGRSPNAHWSRLLPGAHIAPHTGMLNTRLICHIPILTAPQCWFRVGSETRGWEHGVPLVFDDSINHEAKNDGSQERVILLFEIWRPEIDTADREAIGRIFQAIGRYE
ncbi:aspartyl/asparaginyl beta-hydroxylase domain-containing protein [Novosphingobium sp. B 225]|uniref:aspartyl/asparaginyl beta-hydroxylase domain-containing protein n=1 Tax=Novosphingobium sp. B 225 TaxID=1961849 RepID=UPI001595BC9B|nr:aspartyl/asparaginyl beta-hydroxylase domain-containing protein [Novosphingobium sp. B 225]